MFYDIFGIYDPWHQSELEDVLSNFQNAWTLSDIYYNDDFFPLNEWQDVVSNVQLVQKFCCIYDTCTPCHQCEPADVSSSAKKLQMFYNKHYTDYLFHQSE